MYYNHNAFGRGDKSMKKIMLWVMVAVCVVVSVEPVFAVYNAFSPQAQAYNKKMEVILKEIQAFAEKIVAYNKPAFEVQLTKKEREYYPMGFGDDGETQPPLSSIMWNRVYVKDKTLVFAAAEKNKKFTVFSFITTDPAYVFNRNIRVGASAKVLERYFGDTLKNMGDSKGKKTTLYGPLIDGVDGSYPFVLITCEKGIITQIEADFRLGEGDVEVISKKAEKFVERKKKELSFR